MKAFLDIPGWLSEAEGMALFDLAKAPGDGAVVEIGSYKGRSTAFLAQGCKERGSGKVHCVDHFLGSPEMHPGGSNPQPGFRTGEAYSTYSEFDHHMSQFDLRDQIIVHIGKSEDVAQTWHGKIRLLFIDGAHTYDEISKDYWFWPVDGHVCFHDYGNNGWPDVKRFVDNEVKPSNPRLVETLLICRKGLM